MATKLIIDHHVVINLNVHKKEYYDDADENYLKLKMHSIYYIFVIHARV